ncbi:hypothetical protein C1J01_24485, partial [Nonomuraea aridisoli]
MRWSDASTITLLAGQPDLPDAWWRSLPMPRVLAAIGPESLGELLTEIALEHWPAAAIGDVLPALYVLDPEEADEPAVAIALDRAGSWAGLLALTGRELVDQPFIQARPVLNILFTAVLARLAPERPGVDVEPYAAGGPGVAFEEGAAGRAAFHEGVAGHPLVAEEPVSPAPLPEPGAPVEEPAEPETPARFADDSYSTEDEEPVEDEAAAAEEPADGAAPDRPAALPAEAAEWDVPHERADDSAAQEAADDLGEHVSEEAAGAHEEPEHVEGLPAEAEHAEAEYGEGRAAEPEPVAAEPLELHSEAERVEPVHDEAEHGEPVHDEAEHAGPEPAEAEPLDPVPVEAEHGEPVHDEAADAEPGRSEPEVEPEAASVQGAGGGEGQELVESVEAAFAGLDDKTWAVAQNRVFTDEPSAVDQLAKLFAVPPADITATEYELRTRLDQWLASDEAAPFRAHLDELIKTFGPAPSKEQLAGAASWHGAEIRALEVPAWQFVLASLAAHGRQPQVQHVPPQVQFPPPPGGPRSAFGPFP